MGLSREQYNRIMRVYSERKSETAALKRMREAEALKAVPELGAIRKDLSVINEQELRARMRHDDPAVSMLAERRERLFLRKRELLTANGFPEDYLDEVYVCPVCQDKGFLSDQQKCICFKQLEAELCNEQSGLPDFLRGVTFEEIDTDLYNNDAPMQDLPRKAKPYTQREYMVNIVFPKIRMFLDTFDEPGSHNIFMTGAAGTGKTYLSACIGESLMRSLHTVIYVSAGELETLFTRIRFERGDVVEMEARADLIENCDLLIIDDLGTEFSTEVSRSEFFALISHRLGTEKSTIISSNKDLNGIEAAYGDRVASRIKGNYLVLPFFGTDLRLAARYRAAKH